MANGTVVHRAQRPHQCAPGWEWRPSTGEGLYGPPAGALCGVPPDPIRFPAGTVWQCDCGTAWVSIGSPDPGSPGRCGWRREGRIEKWLRNRRDAGLTPTAKED